MEFTGYLDFWFTDRPMAERVQPIVDLGIRRVDAWSWRSQPMAALSRVLRLGLLCQRRIRHVPSCLASR